MTLLLLIPISLILVLIGVYVVTRKNGETSEAVTGSNKAALDVKQNLMIILLVLVGLVFNVFSMPLILIVAIVLKISNTEGKYVTAYYVGLKILAIIYLILLIAFGLCMGIFMFSSSGI